MLKSYYERNSFIFDLDGLVVDTQTPFHAEAECKVLKEYCNVKITPEQISERFAGIPTKKVFKELAPNFDSNLLVREKWRTMLEILDSQELCCMPGMYELIFELHKKGFEISIGSASPKYWISKCLKEARPHNYHYFEDMKLIDMFGYRYYSAEECLNPKPAPDIFLKAHHEMFEGTKLETKCTYVLGDGASDVKAGLAAKMKVIYLSGTNTEFDQNKNVIRFGTSVEVSNYVLNNLI